MASSKKCQEVLATSWTTVKTGNGKIGAKTAIFPFLVVGCCSIYLLGLTFIELDVIESPRFVVRILMLSIIIHDILAFPVVNQGRFKLQTLNLTLPWPKLRFFKKNYNKESRV